MINLIDIENKLVDKVNVENIRKAYDFANKMHHGKKRLSGDEYITHPLEVANILTSLNVDNDTIVVALLHETINNADATIAQITSMFGADIAKAVDSISKINKLELNDDSESSAAYLRKILVGLAQDVRVLYVKLADRLHNMRTNWAVNPLKQKDKARETLNILVPIAHRLGMNSVKSELENLCLEYLKPDVYSDIKEKLNISVEELTDELNNMKKNISKLLTENNINFEIKGRVKSVYSIYNKLSSGKKWDDIFDILALRIFVEKESECYTVVGLIHSKYRPITKRFKDYVASPKANMYQSLHTTIFGDNSNLFEIQIRTYEMNEIAEKGIASHWSYKEKGSKRIQNIMEQKLEMFRNIIEYNQDINDADFEKVIETDFLSEVIYVYTPKGDVVELPSGASPIDFAYRIHSNVGDTTVGAIVNENMQPFTYELNDGDVVKIITNKDAKPNKNWLNIVKTSQAKNKIKAYFSKKLREEYILKGKTILEKEARKRKLAFDEITNSDNLNKVLKDLKINTIEELYLALGSLRYTAGYIINLTNNDKNIVDDHLIDKAKRKSMLKNNKGDIIVDGQSNIVVNLAKCCSPVKGDDITGYITKYGVISVHKKDCDNIDDKSDRIINVQWNYDSEGEYLTKIYIKVSNETNILQNLIEYTTKKNINIVSFDSNNIFKTNVVEVTLKVSSKEEIDNFFSGALRIKNVKDVSLVRF